MPKEFGLSFDDLNPKQQEVLKRYAQQVQGAWDTFREPIKAGYLYRTFNRAAYSVGLTHSVITDLLERLEQIVAFRTPRGGVAFMPYDAWKAMPDSEKLDLIERLRSLGEFRHYSGRAPGRPEGTSSKARMPEEEIEAFPPEYEPPKSIRDFLPEDLTVPS